MTPNEIERPDLEAFMRRRECLRNHVHLDNVIAESFWKTGANDVTYDQAKRAAEYLRTQEAPIIVTAELLDWVEHQEARISALEAKLEEAEGRWILPDEDIDEKAYECCGFAVCNELGRTAYFVRPRADLRRDEGLAFIRTALKGDDNE